MQYLFSLLIHFYDKIILAYPNLVIVFFLAVVAFLYDRDLEKVLQANVVRASPGTGIADRRGSMELMTLYPNPAQEYVYLSLGKPAANQGQITVMDLSGRQVLEADIISGHSIRQLDISSLSEGVYLVNWVESGVILGRGKFVIAR